MSIISFLFFAVKNLAFLFQFFHVLIADSIERHDGVLFLFILARQHEPHNGVQIRVLRFPNHENRSFVLFVY